MAQDQFTATGIVPAFQDANRSNMKKREDQSFAAIPARLGWDSFLLGNEHALLSVTSPA